MINRRISIAPMMDWTDKHERYFLRLIAPSVLLYSEMITTAAIIHGDQAKLLDFNDTEHPLALQLGGNDPKDLAQCAKVGQSFGYDEINLNVGCPSDRVQNGRIGACLMKEPDVVANCVKAMIDAVKVPVTVKSRIGVDDHDSYDQLCHFIESVSAAGCQTFIIHARKAWLKGLSPKQNREVPPLRYEVVYQIKKRYPHLTIILNGGIDTLEKVSLAIAQVDGVMIGREAYYNPYFLSQLQYQFYAETNPLSRIEVLENFLPYMQQQLLQKTKLSAMARHILGLFLGQTNAKKWRRYLSENMHGTQAGIDLMKDSIKILQGSANNDAAL